MPERAVHERPRSVQANPPESVAESARHLERGLHGIVLEVDQNDHVDVIRRVLCEFRRGERGVPAVRSDEPVRNGADPATSPPRGLCVGGNADRAGDVSGIAVARLDAVMVMAGRKEENRLAVGRLDDAAHVRRDKRSARQDAEIDRLQMGEARVVPLDHHHRLPRRDVVSVVKSVDG